MILFMKELFNRKTFRAQLIYEMIQSSLIFLLVLIPVAFLSLVQITPVNSGSMYPTMVTGDVSLQTRRFKDIKRFDVVTSKIDKNMRLEKRVIGLPGETIEIINGLVLIDGELLEDDYAFFSNGAGMNRYMEKIIIEKDEYFIMGDNRDFSYDSRDIGTINKSKIRYSQKFLFNTNKFKKNNEHF